MIIRPNHAVEDFGTIRKYAGKCEAGDPTAARWLGRVADIMDEPAD